MKKILIILLFVPFLVSGQTSYMAKSVNGTNADATGNVTIAVGGAQTLSRTFADSISLSISGSNTVKLPYAVDSVGATSDSIIVYKFGIRKSYTNGGGGGGVSSVTTIGAVPNANGATISGSVLNLQPADGSFGGVVTTSAQTFAGRKTFNGYVTIGAGTTTASPVLLTTGTLKTVAEAGAIEYLSPNFYFTPLAGERITFGMGGASNNMVIGKGAGLGLSSGVQHTFYGVSAGAANANSNYNTSIGYNAGSTIYGNTNYNTFVGWQSGASSFQFAQGKIGIGSSSYPYGDYGIAIGYNAQSGGGTGIISIGGEISANTTAAAGNYGIAIGYEASSASSLGEGNIVIGYRAGNTITTGTKNVVIGYDIDAQSNTASGQLSIQNIIFGAGNTGTGTTVSTGNIGIGAVSPNASSKLEITSTTSGFLPPRMTTAQKNAIATPATGLMVYDTTLNKLCVYTGAAWETITSL